MENKKEETLKKIENQNKPGMHTYASDMIKVLEYNQGGLARRIIEQEEKKDFDRANSSPVSKRNKLFLIGSIFFILASFAVLIYVYLEDQKSRRFFPQDFSNYVSPIFLDGSSFVDISSLDKGQIAQALIQKKENISVRKDGIEGLFLVEGSKIVGFEKFLSKIEGNFDKAGFERMKDDFLFGLVYKEEPELFLLLSVNSFQEIFPYIKSWEERMFFDFYPFLGISLDANTNKLLTKNFQDGIVQNKNARYLYDESGKLILMYVYATDNAIIIAQNEEAVKEVIDRLTSTKIRR